MSEEMETNVHPEHGLQAVAPILYGKRDLDAQEAALAAYEAAIALAPHEPRFHYSRGRILQQLGQLAEAQRAFEEGRRLEMNA